MGEIERGDIEEAFRRWQDFMALQPLNEMTTAEGAPSAQARADDPLAIARLDAIRESVGIGRDTWLAFVVVMQRHMDEMPPMAAIPDDAGPEEVLEAVRKGWEEKVDTAALIGLVVGLTARQLADERND